MSRNFYSGMVTSEGLLLDGCQGFVGRANQRRRFVKNNRHRNIVHQRFKFPFVLEGLKKRTVLNFVQYFYGNSACHEYVVEGHNSLRQISRFRNIEGTPYTQRFHAPGARFIQSLASDNWRRVGVGIFKCGMSYSRGKKFMQSTKAAPCKNQFPAYLRVEAGG